VDSGLFDVLHDACEVELVAVVQGVNIDLDGIVEEPVNQHRVLWADLRRTFGPAFSRTFQRTPTDASPYGVDVTVDYTRGIPPVINDDASVRLIERVTRTVLGDGSVETIEQSLGGEDFAWYLAQVPGALFRLGVQPPDRIEAGDLHQGTFDVDESAIAIGVRLLVAAAVSDLAQFGKN